jgi:RimJ/RimL family protein N-acetyltransferase
MSAVKHGHGASSTLANESMNHAVNEFGQPIGFPLPDWTPPPHPPREPMVGRSCRLEPLEPAIHAAALYEAYAGNDSGWTYLTCGPFHSLESYRDWMDSVYAADDPMFFAILNHGKPVGVASYMRISPSAGSIEVGHVNFSPALQRSTVATEAMYLMMDTAFRLGYRRYEWKCDDLNAASRAAARRLGFSNEGTTRQATVYKGRTRDTAWHSIIDTEWPALREAFEAWLDPGNFDSAGQQRSRLSDLTSVLSRKPERVDE